MAKWSYVRTFHAESARGEAWGDQADAFPCGGNLRLTGFRTDMGNVGKKCKIDITLVEVIKAEMEQE